MSRTHLLAIAGAVAALAVGTIPGHAWAAAPAAGAPGISAARASIGDCPDVTNRVVGRGSKGPYVREVQCLLNTALSMETHDWIPVDGDFGPATEAKTKDFQSCANYYLGAGLVVDGKVGPKTAWWLEYVARDAAPFC